MWGLPIRAATRSAVASLGLPAIPRAFFIISGDQHKTGALTSGASAVQRVILDGTTAWPSP